MVTTYFLPTHLSNGEIKINSIIDTGSSGNVGDENIAFRVLGQSRKSFLKPISPSVQMVGPTDEIIQ